MTASFSSANRRGASAGFTLIEMAVALVIMAMLLGSILVPLNTQVEERQASATEKTLENIKEALMGFAAANGYLPCPDLTTGANSNDGVEDYVVATGLCTSITGGVISIGNLPWATLGLSTTADTWGNRYRYAVIATFAQRSPAAAFSLTTTAANALRICTTAACTTQVVDAGTTAAVAVILSHGRNGWGAINSLTNAANTASTSADEIENADTDTDFVYRTRTAIGATAGEFDDIVTWVSRSLLMSRMVTAGKLP